MPVKWGVAVVAELLSDKVRFTIGRGKRGPARRTGAARNDIFGNDRASRF